VEKKFNEKERKCKIKLPKKVCLECLHILDVVNNYTSFELTASLRLWKLQVVVPPPLLLAILFDNSLKQAQNNTVVYQNKRNGPGGS
jgi:hypothetical protein